MTEAQLFEKVGRLTVSVEAQNQAYDQLLGLLAGVVGGTVEPSRVLVNLSARSWTLATEGFRPELPATINGEPRCVAGPAESEADRLRAELAAAKSAVEALEAIVAQLRASGPAAAPEG